MFLLKGKIGTVLHTGDFRFSEFMFKSTFLFPESKRNLDMQGISIDLDYLFLDNTFADPDYDTPSREQAYKMLLDIVKKHNKYRVFLFAYSLGKEEVFMNLAEDFQTLIVVDEDRYRKICAMDLRPELFTTKCEEGWIHIKSIRDLKKYDIQDCNKEAPTIFIILTGWNDKYNSNLPFYFKVPYSSHSNHREIERFVKAIMPKNLVFNVPDRAMSKR